jgi:hypothetical protein
VAGPWFAVHESGGDWQQLDSLWVSDGGQAVKGRIEIKLKLAEGESNAS